MWISVKERLPLPDDERDFQVLTAGGLQAVARYRHVDNYGDGDAEDRGYWLPSGAVAGYDAYLVEPITHWQALPEPPVQN